MWPCFINSILLSFLYVAQANECIPRNSYLESLLCKKIVHPDRDCIIRYDCKHSLETKVGTDQCFYGGKVYNRRSRIEANEQCKFGCYCDYHGKVTCAAHDCPIYDTPLTKGCYYSNQGHGCCPTDIICESQKDVYSCFYDEKVYLEGMEFYPEPCTKCICQKGFIGKIESPFCEKVKCLANMNYYTNLKQRCAPIYYKNECCPALFTCADETDEFLVENSLFRPNSSRNPLFKAVHHPNLGNMCVYGNDFLHIGDVVVVSTITRATCTCITPPVLTCVAMKEHYESSITYDEDY